MNAVELSLVIPCHNEEENLQPLLSAIHAALDPLALDYEIVITDDCSTDNSWNVLNNSPRAIGGCVSSVSNSIAANRLRAGQGCRPLVAATSPRWMPISKTTRKIYRECLRRSEMQTAFAGHVLQREAKATIGFALPHHASLIGCATNSPVKTLPMPAALIECSNANASHT